MPATYRLDNDADTDSTLDQLRAASADEPVPAETWEAIEALPVGGCLWLDCGGGATPVERVS